MIQPVRWKTRFEFLTDADVQAIHQASLHIMERIGLVMPLDSLKASRDWHRS